MAKIYKPFLIGDLVITADELPTENIEPKFYEVVGEENVYHYYNFDKKEWGEFKAGNGVELKPLQAKSVSGVLDIYDGETKLTMLEIKDLYHDPKWFIYLEYLNIVMIPEARYLETSNAFEFGGQFQENGQPYMARVIINNENVVKYNQISIENYNNKVYGIEDYDESNEEQYFNAITVKENFAEKLELTLTGTMNTSTLPSMVVPKLTKTQVETIYNAIGEIEYVKLKDTMGEYVVTEADKGAKEVRFTYFGAHLAYYIDGNNVIAEYSKVDISKIESSSISKSIPELGATDGKLTTEKAVFDYGSGIKDIADEAKEIAEGKTNAKVVAEMPTNPERVTQYFVGNDEDGYTVKFVDSDGKIATLERGVDLTGYAKEDGTYLDMTVGKAVNDENGDDIAITYATKTEVQTLETEVGKKFEKVGDGLVVDGTDATKINIANNVTAQATAKLSKLKFNKYGEITEATEVPVANNLTTTTEGSVLDARQGKALDDSKFTYIKNSVAVPTILTGQSYSILVDGANAVRDITKDEVDTLTENLIFSAKFAVDGKIVTQNDGSKWGHLETTAIFDTTYYSAQSKIYVNIVQKMTTLQGNTFTRTANRVGLSKTFEQSLKLKTNWSSFTFDEWKADYIEYTDVWKVGSNTETILAQRTVRSGKHIWSVVYVSTKDMSTEGRKYLLVANNTHGIKPPLSTADNWWYPVSLAVGTGSHALNVEEGRLFIKGNAIGSVETYTRSSSVNTPSLMITMDWWEY